jgi:cobalt-zinc-cadmium efflux system protein
MHFRRKFGVIIPAFFCMAHEHHHSHHHDHNHSTGEALTVAFWLNTAFAIIELAGGLYTNSVAITTDALHDFGDSLSLGMAYYFHRKSLQARDQSFTYGYRRFSLLGAFINSFVLIIGSAFILQESIKRLAHPEEANAKGMIILAVIGLAVNLAAMLRLRKSGSLNEQVVSLHFLEDVLRWVAVLIGSVVMLFARVPVLDPILSLVIAGYILFNVYRNLRYAFRIFLQGAPLNINPDEIRKKVLGIHGIKDMHDFHTWTMDGTYNIMTMHVVLEKQLPVEKLTALKNEVRHCLHHLNIQHITIETEFEGDDCEVG